MDKKTQTINSYNNSAQPLAEKFDKLGARVSDIKEAFELTEKTNPRVLEIGCGNGRDAGEILRRTDDYLGIDVSEKMIEIAWQRNPDVKFEVRDIESYVFPQKLDIIFAFASLIHIPKEKLREVLSKSFSSLNKGGIVRMSMKYNDVYIEKTKEDSFGIRTYFLYSKKDIEQLAGDFKILKNELKNLNGQDWLEVMLKK